MLAFRARRLQGEVYAILGDEAGVTAIRQDLERWSRQLGLHANAATIVGPFQPPQLDDRAFAQLLAKGDPEMQLQIEEAAMRSLGLPEERRPIVRRELEAIQRTHREQLDHCRHLGVLQDLRHTRSKATHYARDPGRVGQCALLGHRSRIEDTDVNAVIRAFKRAFCEACTSRQPFERI